VALNGVSELLFSCCVGPGKLLALAVIWLEKVISSAAWHTQVGEWIWPEDAILKAWGGLMQGVSAASGDAQAVRPGPVTDRWEPGSDFESSKPVLRTARRKLNGIDSSASAGRAATPQQAVPSPRDDPVTENVPGPARSDRSLHRSEPASCLLLLACLHVVQGGAGAEHHLVRGQRGVEMSCPGHREAGGCPNVKQIFRMEGETQLVAVC